MNRLEMEDIVATRVPMLAQRDKDEWKRAETLRKAFVHDYPIVQIPNLSLDEYVIGKGADNRSFCYRIEREMDSLGRILGATAFKFGVYHGRTETDEVHQYRFGTRWGTDLNEAFAAVKQSIVDLLNAAEANDHQAINSNALSPMFKGKLLFLYHPDDFAPIYSKEHLQHFVAQLNIGGFYRYGPDFQRALMEYRVTWPLLMIESAALYMRFLYDLFGYPPDEANATGAQPDPPLLNDAVSGAQFIESMPLLSEKAAVSKMKKGKIDHEKTRRNNKLIGDRGEAIVLALEEDRLIKAGRTDLVKRLEHIADHDDGAGFDILSFDEDGTERPIEVKSTTSHLDPGFYLTANELEKSKELTNYHFYFVFSAMSKNPRIFRLKEPKLEGPDFSMRPLTFHVTRTTTVA